MLNSKNIIINLEEKSFKNLSNEIEVLIIWPKNLWGGFSKDKIPDNLQKKKFGVVFLKKRYITLSFREFIEKINLIWFLLFKLKGLKGISKLSYMAWCFSQQPFAMSNMISNLEKNFTILKNYNNKIKNIYYPFEFYPESKICFKIAKDFKLKSMTAQHMKWTNEKLSRFTGQSELVELPEIIFLSKQQNSNIFSDLKIKYKKVDWVGRFDDLISKSVKLNFFDNLDSIQILTSGSPYDIHRAFLFSWRILKNKKEKIRLILHPKTSNLIFLFLKFITLSMNIYISKGFDGEISKSKPTLTCGTSLYAILKKKKN